MIRLNEKKPKKKLRFDQKPRKTERFWIKILLLNNTKRPFVVSEVQ